MLHQLYQTLRTPRHSSKIFFGSSFHSSSSCSLITYMASSAAAITSERFSNASNFSAFSTAFFKTRLNAADNYSNPCISILAFPFRFRLFVPSSICRRRFDENFSLLSSSTTSPCSLTASVQKVRLYSDETSEYRPVVLPGLFIIRQDDSVGRAKLAPLLCQDRGKRSSLQ